MKKMLKIVLVFILIHSILYCLYVLMVKIADTCIGCGVCGSIAPTVFEVHGVPATVVKQPETPEEHQAVDQAKTACPMWAIQE